MPKKEFNPNDFFTITTVGDIAPKFPQLSSMDFSKESLNSALTRLNYEITSPEYRDFLYPTLEEYFDFEVDTIV